MEKCCSIDVLLTAGIRKTLQRSKVLDCVIELKKVFTVNEIFEIVSDEMNVDLATIYRIINLFTEKKIIREVINTGGVQYFELSCVHNPTHPHFICELCNKVECLESLELDQVSLRIKSKNNFKVNTVSINLSGLCDRCIKESK